MHRYQHALGDALIALASFINDPREDWRMMEEAGLDLDPVFLPLLVRLGAQGPAGGVELAEKTGRDHSTMSRQLARLEASGLVERMASPLDGRLRTAHLTPQGQAAVQTLAEARGRLLNRALADWSKPDQEALSQLLGRFVNALRSATVERSHTRS